MTAVCTEALASPRGKRSFLRVHLERRGGQYVATPVSGSGSHLLAGLARANALVVAAGGGRAGRRRRRRRRHGPGEARPMTGPRLTHLDEAGAARMVDVTGKDVTARTATATGRVRPVGRDGRPAARRGRAQGRRARGGAGRRDHGRQAHPRPRPAVPPGRAVRRHRRPRGRRRGRRRHRRRPQRRPHRRRDGGADRGHRRLPRPCSTCARPSTSAAVITDVRVEAKTGGKSGAWTR